MASNGFSKPYMLQVATKGELAKCPDMLLGRYNGHPGEDISDFQLENRGSDPQWYWRDLNGTVRSGWPLKVRAGGFVAIPNCKENLEILAAMKDRKWSERVRTDSGHIERTVDHPPLYELLTDEVEQVSPETLLGAFAAMSQEDRAKLMGLLTEPAAPVAQKGRKGDKDKDLETENAGG